MSLIKSADEYFVELVDLFKYTFEMCNVLPPLSIYLPQLSVTSQTVAKAVMFECHTLLNANSCHGCAMCAPPPHGCKRMGWGGPTVVIKATQALLNFDIRSV